MISKIASISITAKSTTLTLILVLVHKDASLAAEQLCIEALRVSHTPHAEQGEEQLGSCGHRPHES